MKRLLIVVDYQNDFVSGDIGFSKAIDLENKIVNKINKYRENKDEIVFTFDTHSKDYLNTHEGKNLPIVHCVKGTYGWNLYGKVKEAKKDSDICFEKDTFGSIDLLLYLKDKTYASIELVGVVSNICVLSNAILAKTALPNIPIVIDSECVASNDDTLNKYALEVMKNLHIEII